MCQESVRQLMRRMGFSYKKSKKLLSRACPEKRAIHQAKMNVFLAEAQRGERTLVFMDPAHIQRDVDLGYGWGLREKPLYVASPSIGLRKRTTFFGAYIYNEGKVWLRPAERANAATTCEVLSELKERLKDAPKITIIWDNASYHRAKRCHRRAAELGMEIVHLPPYSPDLMPVEELWNWFRTNVTRNRFFAKERALIEAAQEFQDIVNTDVYAVADRLIVLEELDPAFEELLAS